MTSVSQVSQRTLIEIACRTTRDFRNFVESSTNSSQFDSVQGPRPDRMVRPFKYPHNESDLQEALEEYYRAHGGFPQEVGVCEAKSTSYKEFEQHFAAEDHWKPIDCGSWLREYWWIDDLLRDEIKMLYENWQKDQEELTDEIEKLKEELEKWDKNYDELEERYKRMDKIYKEVCKKLEDILKRRPDTKQLD